MKGDLMRKTVSKALDSWHPSYGPEFSGMQFFEFFKELPTGNGMRRKIYPAGANAMATLLKKLPEKVQVVEGSAEPLLFIKVCKEEIGSDTHSQHSD